MKKYKLLKDMAYIKAGAIYEEASSREGYETHEAENSPFDYLKKCDVENNPEWFEEVKEDKVEELISKINKKYWGDNSDRTSFKNDLRLFIKDNGKEEVINLLHKLVGQTYNPLDVIKQIQDNYIIIKI